MTKDLSKYIDFTYLNEDVTEDKIAEICKTAKDKAYFAVCCPSLFVNLAKSLLKDSGVKIVTVVSFPNGTDILESKLFHTRKAIEDGADEIDVVMNYKLLKLGLINEIQKEITILSRTIHKNGKILKIIIESGELDYKEIKTACEICSKANVDFVKTSTGKTKSGAEIDKVKYMRSILPENILIKASGGIKTKEQMLEFIEAGAVRIGTSAII